VSANKFEIQVIFLVFCISFATFVAVSLICEADQRSVCLLE